MEASSRGRGSRARRVAAILGAQLLLLVLLFLVAETAVRWKREGSLGRALASYLDARAATVDPGTIGYFLHDEELGYRLNPESEGFNALSFRAPR